MPEKACAILTALIAGIFVGTDIAFRPRSEKRCRVRIDIIEVPQVPLSLAKVILPIGEDGEWEQELGIVRAAAFLEKCQGCFLIAAIR